MNHKPRVNMEQAKILRTETGCGMHAAVTALDMREGILEFAREYLERRDIAIGMSPEDRYPKWAQYLEQRRKA